MMTLSKVEPDSPEPGKCIARFQMKGYGHVCYCANDRNHAPAVNHVCQKCGIVWNSGGLQSAPTCR
jgi:hypothetical protein